MDDSETDCSIDNASIKLDNLQKEAESCLSSLAEGHGQLVVDCFAADNFVSKFSSSQPTTQKAKHFYESYLHLHNITSKIPPRYSALLQEQAIEWDRKWRRSIRISYEMIHQSLCLVAFYQKVICALFDPRHYHKTSALHSVLNKSIHRKVLQSVPWGDRQDLVPKELSWYQSRLTVLRKSDVTPTAQHVVSRGSVRDWFIREAGDLKMCSPKGKVYVILNQMHTLRLRLVFLRKTLEPECEDVNTLWVGNMGKVSVGRHLLGKLQVAHSLVRQLVSYPDVTPNVVTPDTANMWTEAMGQSLQFLEGVVSLADDVVGAIRQDMNLNDDRFDAVSAAALSTAPTDYLVAVKEALAEIGDIDCKYGRATMAQERCFTSWKKTRSLDNSANTVGFVYKKKNDESNESEEAQLESRWEALRSRIHRVCGFEGGDREEKVHRDDEGLDEVDTQSEYDEGADDVDSEHSEFRGEYPMMSLFRMLSQVMELFDVVIRGFGSICSLCKECKTSILSKDWVSNLCVNGGAGVMKKGMEIICTVIKLVQVDGKEESCRLLSGAMTKALVVKTVWETMSGWADQSMNVSNSKMKGAQPGFIKMCCNVLEHVIGNLVSGGCIWSGDPSLSDGERLNRMRKSLSKTEQRAVTDVTRRMALWMDHLEEEHGRNAVAAQHLSAEHHCHRSVDFLKRCSLAVRWLDVSAENVSAESTGDSASKYVHPALFKMLAEGDWTMADLYDIKHFDGRSLLPFLSYLNSEFSKIYRGLKTEHGGYRELEDELVSMMQQWSSDRYPVRKDGKPLISDSEKKDDEVRAPEPAVDGSVSSSEEKASPKMVGDGEDMLFGQREESLEDAVMESEGDDEDNDPDEDAVDDEVNEDEDEDGDGDGDGDRDGDGDDEDEGNEDGNAVDKKRRGKSAPKRKKSPFAQKRKKEAKIKQMENFIRKSVEQVSRLFLVCLCRSNLVFH